MDSDTFLMKCKYCKHEMERDNNVLIATSNPPIITHQWFCHNCGANYTHRQHGALITETWTNNKLPFEKDANR